jgi:hypothetical protein
VRADRRIGWAAFALTCLPLAAQAECLGQGCYKGLGLLIGLAIAFLVGVLVMVILMFMRRWRAVQVLAVGLVSLVIAGAYMLN